jgi:NAD-dependent dihydropyrimidine dehydrogenase PreA subunit
LFRALNRAGLDYQGGLGCDPGAPRAFDAAPGRWAAVAGARAVLEDARAVLASSARAGAALVVVADVRAGPAADVQAALEALGARACHVNPGDLAAVEAAARAAVEPGRVQTTLGREVLGREVLGREVLVAVSGCARGAPRSPPFAIAPSRCNRCGACLALGCPAISDPGGEAIAIDPATCTGCGLCPPLCRGRAIAR